MAEDMLTVDKVEEAWAELQKRLPNECVLETMRPVFRLARRAATEMPKLEEKLAIEVEHSKAFAKLADKKTDLANFIATDVRNEFADQLATATAQVEQMREALEKCAARFEIGTPQHVDWEGIAREFSVRQQIARETLVNLPSTNYEEKIKSEVLREFIAYFEKEQTTIRPEDCARLFAAKHNMPIDKEGE